ncbi:MAG: hypothetical protein ACFB15_07400 [Cyclobacteriaceae bacterium]
MKTTILYFITIIALAMTLGSCQTEEVAPLRPIGWLPGDKTPHPIPTSIPPAEVIRTEFSGATKWRITFNDPKFELKWAYQRFFSTVDGSFRNLADLNSSMKATSRVDMDFLFGYARSPHQYDNHLTYPEAAVMTKFKPSDMSAWDLAVATELNPTEFQTAFESSPFEAVSFQPYNYDKYGDESSLYQDGDIFLFKTDRNPARYGAIRIVEASLIYQGIGPRIVEVIVQADNNVFQLKN